MIHWFNEAWIIGHGYSQWWKTESVKFQTICSRLHRPIVWCPDLRYHDGGSPLILIISISAFSDIFRAGSYQTLFLKGISKCKKPAKGFGFLRRISTFKLSSWQIALKCKYQIPKYVVPSFRKFEKYVLEMNS